MRIKDSEAPMVRSRCSTSPRSVVHAALHALARRSSARLRE